MKLKKILGVSILSVAILGAVAMLSSARTVETIAAEAVEKTVAVTVENEKGEAIEVEFPKNPNRIVALNLQTVDFLDAVGMGDKIVGMIKEGVFPEHLQKYVDDKSIVNVGGMKDVDMEAVMSLQPDVIFSSDRTAKMYKEFSMIAPTMAAFVDYEAGFMNGFKNLADQHSAIFGVEDELDEIITEYDARIERIADFAEGKTALLGIFAGGLNTLGNTGRASIVVNEMGFENLAADKNINHGNVSSYEAWLKYDPDYMFVLDKDGAVGTKSVAAKEQMEKNNPVIAQTSAYKEGKIIYLEPADVWYMADGGITGMDLMISNIEEGLGLPEYK